MSVAVDNALAAVPAAAGYEKSFTEFTVTLVRDVFDALVGSAINQMKAYAEFVSELEKGLTSFRSSRTSREAVTAWLQANLPEVTPGAQTEALKQSSADLIRNLYVTRLPSVVLLPTPPDGTSYNLPLDGAGAPSNLSALVGQTLTAVQVGNLPGAALAVPPAPLAAPNAAMRAVSLIDALVTVLAADAEQSYSELNTLIQMGLLRIVVTEGHILTRMTFSLETSEQSERVASDVYRSNFSAGGGGSASFKAFQIGAKASYSRIRVKVSTEKTTTSTEILTTVMGEVKVNFRGDFFPALPSQAKQ